VKGTSFAGIGSRDPENTSMIPRLLVLFNANVDASAAAKFIRFENAAHNRIAARVEQADPKKHSFPRWESDDKSLSAWSAQPVPEETEETSDSEEEESATAEKKPQPARGNVLFVAPVKPLPPGNNWRLVIDKGLPANEWKTTMPAAREVLLGTVQKFAIKEAKAEGNHIDGRRIIINFTKAIAEDVSAETINRWIKVDPVPPNLKTTVVDDSVTLRGDYSLGTRYRVSVGSGLPAREPTETSAPFKQEVAFEKYDSRLYFQDITAHQYVGGTRQLRLLSVNVPRLRVSAKIFTGADVPAALKAFDAYEERPEDLPDEMYTRVNVESLGGKVIWEKEITPGGPVDSQQIVPLNWNEMVGKNHGGAVVFTAESLDPVGPDRKRVGTQTLMQLTDLGAVWKRDRDTTFLHVFSLANGKGISGAHLQLIDNDLKPLEEGTTDEHGDARLTNPDGARWVFLQTNDDAHLVSLSSSENSLSPYHFGITDEGSDDDAEGRYAKTIFLFTERGVYKPGDKLHLKGYAQDPRNDEARIPSGKQLTITVNDAKERQIFSGKVTLSEFGSFDQEIALPKGSLGRYSIVAAGEKGERLGGYCSFQVQEYKP
ncbi:MAG: MG2 domain-containing protein, partial [Chthoniobacterales bacterium]